MTKDPLEGTSYRATGVLGQGAMGIVLDAEHRALRKRVCVKVLLERHAIGRPDLVDRLRAEAQALANLRHDGLVEVTDFGVTPLGRPYFVMERLVGRTLKDELDARGFVTQREALRWCAEALDTLEVTHAAGVVHRDLKPANLFLCQHADPMERKIKLLDFGVAKIREGAEGVAPLAIPTEEGTAVGTPRYLSPEQVLGHPIDGRCDIYAMGLVLSTLLAGRGPFDDAASDAEIAVARIQRPAPRLSSYAKSPIPEELDIAVARALAMNPAHRFARARDFASELRSILAHVGAPPAVRAGSAPNLAATELMQPAEPPPSKLQATLAATAPMHDGIRHDVMRAAVARAAHDRAAARPSSAAPAQPPAKRMSPATIIVIALAIIAVCALVGWLAVAWALSAR
jgi:eukaryotic-like serine/threonine-protein kinase